MMEHLNVMGHWSWGAVWLPVLVWTVLCLGVQLGLRFVPASYLRLHRDLRFALLLALPLGLALGMLVPEFGLASAPLAEAGMTTVVVAQTGADLQASPLAQSAAWWSAASILGLVSLAALLAALGASILLAASAWRLRQILSGASPYSGEIPDSAAGVPVFVSDEISVPISSGLFRRVIILPRQNPNGCSLAILHESTHHTQGDIGRVLITRAIGATFVAHPLVHALMKRLYLLMEMICDQIVLSRSGSDPAEYANLLLAYVPSARAAGPLTALSMGRSHDELRKRISAMRSPQHGSRWLSTAAAAILFGLVSGVVGCVQADSPPASATEYEISGLVTDSETGEPLVGANVQLDGTGIGSVTDDGGRYTIRSIPDGSYELRISHRGREVKTENITVPEANPFHFDARSGRRESSLTIRFTATGALMVEGKEITLRELTEVIERLHKPTLELDVHPLAPVGRYMEALEAFRRIQGTKILTETVPTKAVPLVLELVAEPETEEVFVVVEEMPELVGGLEALQREIRYPEIAKRAGIEGRVIVQFVVTETGEVVDPVIVRGIGAGADEEALRAVLNAEFLPGRQRGKKVKVKMSLPVTFRLTDRSIDSGSVEMGARHDIEVFTHAADVGREFEVVFTGRIEWNGDTFKISALLLPESDALITGTRTAPPNMGPDASTQLSNLEIGQVVGIRYLD